MRRNGLVAGNGSVLKNVQRGAAEATRLQNLNERSFVHDGPARSVDQDGTGLERRQRASIEEMITARIEITVDADVVGSGEQRPQVRHFNAALTDKYVVDLDDVIAQDPHAEGPCTACHGFSDVAHSDDPESPLAEGMAGLLSASAPPSSRGPSTAGDGRTPMRSP